jgi:hypothetical protein
VSEKLYTPASRALQERFGTREFANTLAEKVVHHDLSPADRESIEGADMLFLASVDARGRVNCSYKGGPPGFVRVLDERTLAFPSYPGNGMYLSAGAVAETGQVGLLFIDFERRRRLRVNGLATLDTDHSLPAAAGEPQFLVRVRIREVFANCSRHIHKMTRKESQEEKSMSGMSRAGEMKESAVSVDGVELCYVEWPGEGVPLVLLHGLGGNAYWWRALVDELPGRRVIAFDLPGHGRSAPQTDWDLERTASLVREAASRVVGGAAIWGGQSWGGKVAALIAGMDRGDVSALVLMDSAPVQGIPIPPAVFVDGRFGGELGPFASVQAAVEAVKSLPQYRGWSESLQSAFLRGLERNGDGTWSAVMGRERALAIARAALGVDHSTQVAGVRCPTLLVMAAESVSWHERTNVVAFPKATRSVVPGGHWIHTDNPAGCAAAITAWPAASR